jgi:ATP-dependent RNA helicase DDX19/DBP5
MIGQSQSGTGKTAAFVLTMLSRINYEREMVQAICLSPTRELARQIVDVAKEMGKYTPVKVCLAIKESRLRDQHVKDHIVVGTPGTMLDILRKKAADPRQVNVFVLDEADNMLDLQGLGEQSMRVKKYISLRLPTNSRFIPKDAQMLLFSATFPSEVHIFAKKFAPNANEITLRLEELSVEGIKQLYMDCRNEKHKYEVLVGLYGLMNIGQSIIFVAVISSEMSLIAETRYCRGNR